MIRLVHLFTGADGQSHFEEGNAPMVPPGLAVDPSRKAPATTIYFEESAAGSSLDWHNDPHRRYVITLTGTVEFETRVGQTFTLGSYRVSGWSAWEGIDGRGERLRMGPPASIGAAHAASGEPVVADR